MLETIRLKSFGSISCRIRSSTLRDVLIRHLNAGSGGHFDVDGELAGIGLGEKRQSQQRVNRQAQEEHATRAPRP